MSLIAPMEIQEIVREFMEKYYDAESFRECVIMCGYSQYYVMEWATRKIVGENKSVAQIREEIIKKGEDPYGWVLQIGLRKKIPEGIEIPDEFKGLKIYVEWIGNIAALKKNRH